MAETDVVILGGGPAGLAAAITCANRDLKVTLLDDGQSPKHATSESLHPQAEPLLDRLGVLQSVLKAGLQRFAGAVVAWDGPEFFDPFLDAESGPALGTQLRRDELDAILLQHAQDLGVRVWQPAQATGLIRSDKRVVGVKTTRGQVLARFTIDATGSRRVLGDWIRLRDERIGSPRSAWSGFARGSCPARDAVPALRVEGQGWTWVARVSDSTYTWTHLNLQNRKPPRGWVPTELTGATPLGRVQEHDVTWRLAAQPAGPGYFLVGDAAAVLDPALQHGIVQALMSGHLAGNLIGLNHKLILNLKDIKAIYNNQIHTWFQKDAAQLGTFYGRLSTRPATATAFPVSSARLHRL